MPSLLGGSFPLLLLIFLTHHYLACPSDSDQHTVGMKWQPDRGDGAVMGTEGGSQVQPSHLGQGAFTSLGSDIWDLVLIPPIEDFRANHLNSLPSVFWTVWRRCRQYPPSL